MDDAPAHAPAHAPPAAIYEGLRTRAGGGHESLLLLQGRLPSDGDGSMMLEYDCLPGQEPPFEARLLSSRAESLLPSRDDVARLYGSLTINRELIWEPHELKFRDMLTMPLSALVSQFQNQVAKADEFKYMIARPKLVTAVVDVRHFRFELTLPPFYTLTVADHEQVTSLPFFSLLGLADGNVDNPAGRFWSNPRPEPQTFYGRPLAGDPSESLARVSLDVIQRHQSYIQQLNDASQAAYNLQQAEREQAEREQAEEVGPAPKVERQEEEASATTPSAAGAEEEGEEEEDAAGEDDDDDEFAEAEEGPKLLTPDTDCTLQCIPLREAREAYTAAATIPYAEILHKDAAVVTQALARTLNTLTQKLNLKGNPLGLNPEGRSIRRLRPGDAQLTIQFDERLAELVRAQPSTQTFNLSETFRHSKEEITLRPGELSSARKPDLYPYVLLAPGVQANSYVAGLGKVCIMGYFDNSHGNAARTTFKLPASSGFLQILVLDSHLQRMRPDYDIDFRIVLRLNEASEQPML